MESVRTASHAPTKASSECTRGGAQCRTNARDRGTRREAEGEGANTRRKRERERVCSGRGRLGGWEQQESATRTHTQQPHTHVRCGTEEEAENKETTAGCASTRQKPLCLEEEPREERTLLLWERGEETSVNLCALLVCLNPTSSNSPTEIESTNISLERYLYLSLYSYKSTLRILSITITHSL